MEKQNLKPIISILLLTLIIGLSYLKFGIIFPPGGDTVKWYNPLALSLVQNHGFSIEGEQIARITPGYPLFLALIYYLFGYNYSMVYIVQFLLLAGIGIIVYFIAKRHLKLSSTFSFLASAMVVTWPYFILYSTLILTEILFTFLLLLSVYFLLELQENPSLYNSLISGGVLGATTLVRPVTLLLPFWAVFFFFVFLRKWRKKAYLLKTILILVVFIVTLAPWTIRNILLHKSILVSSGLESAIGKGYKDLDYTQGSQALKPGEVDLKTLLVARLKNIYLFWNPGAQGERAQTLLEKYPFVNHLFSVYKLLFFTILALAFFSLKFIGLRSIYRAKSTIKKRGIFLLWIIIFYFWGLHTILFPYPRYTLPIIPLVILLSLCSISYLSSQYKRKYISR